jgi:DNA-binding SARP family transcriptional activator/tetratricopeptide (TPR) repeat protein
MGALAIRLLGAPSVTHDGVAVVSPSRRALALLFYLAAERRAVARAELATLLWPDSDDARTALRVTLSRLRAALGPTEHATVHLEISAETVALRGELTIDLAAYEQNETALVVPDVGDGEFLDGFTLDGAPAFDAWLEAKREGWRRRLDRRDAALVAALAAAGDVQAAAQTAERWWRRVPTHEPAARAAMRAAAAAGDGDGALGIFSELRAQLRARLDSAPSAETMALAERLRRLPRSSAPAAAREANAGRMPFVGRSESFAALVEEFARARHGPRAVWIGGEAGIGKTRLANEFERWAATEGADTLHGRAFEVGGRLPYGPLIDALRPRLARERAPDDLLSDVWLAELARLLPELRDRYPDLAQLPADDATPARIAEAIARLGAALAAAAPLVLTMDDLQWSDETTRDALLYCARRWTEERVPALLLFVARPDEPGGTSLAPFAAALRRDAPLRDLPLWPLEARDARDLAITLMQNASDDPETAGEAIAAVAGGQPFYIVETVAMLRGDALDDAPVTLHDLRARIPARVRDVIAARLARLSPPAAGLLLAASLAGRQTTSDDLVAVAAVAEADAETALDDLTRAGLIAAGSAGYVFAHDHIRALVVESAGPARRQAFARRLYSRLRDAGAEPAALAVHALEARLLPEAFAHTLDAGAAALAVAAGAEARAQFGLAEQLRAEGVAVDASTLRRLYEGLGRAYELGGDFGRAREAFAALTDAGSTTGSPMLEAAGLLRLGLLDAQRSFDLASAEPALLRAAQRAEAAGEPRMQIEAECHLSLALSYVGRVLPSIHHAERAVQHARVLADPHLLARCLNSLALPLAAAARWVEATAALQEACALMEPLGDRALLGDSLGQLGHTLMALGRAEEALRSAEAALALARVVGSPWGEAAAGFTLADAYLELGRPRAALSAARDARAAADSTGVLMLRFFCARSEGAARRALGQYTEATAVHREAQTLLADGPLALREMAVAELCADAVATGEPALAAELARERLSYASNTFYVRDGVTRHAEVRALLSAGMVAEAHLVRDSLAEAADHAPRYRLALLRCAALIAAQSRDQGATALFEEAEELAASLSLPLERRDILLDAAQAARDSGELQRAVKLEAEARAVSPAEDGADT